MNIMKLKIVILLEKYKKVTDVAAELGLKQPTVSFHMKNLENEFGTPLFQYRSGRVLLTDAGRALYQYALKIVSLTAEAERTVKQFSSPTQGTLKLEASYIPATYILPKALIQFMKQYPGINNSMTIQSDTLLKERLEAGKFKWLFYTLLIGMMNPLTFSWLSATSLCSFLPLVTLLQL